MGVQSAGYTENGKLTINEDKLDTALSTKSEQVKDFFLGETGFGNAMKNAVNSAVKTSGPKGSRGALIEKAGIGNTASDTENNITSKIKDIKKYIETLQDRLEQRQQYWWKKFSALESLVSNMDGMSSLIGAYTSN
jgi:flagellar hook-associated protein 2